MASKRAIVFIDGNNFYHRAKRAGIAPSTIDYLKLSGFICSKFGLFLRKTIYYNSIPDIRDGKEKYYAHMRFLSGLEALPNFEVRSRKLQTHSNRELIEEKARLLASLGLCAKCGPKVEKNCMACIGDAGKKEKGIDVWLAVEMIELALKGEYDFAVLVSGDGDFIPALKLILSNGKKIKSASVRSGYSYDIRNTFPDDFMYLDAGVLAENCSKVAKPK